MWCHNEELQTSVTINHTLENRLMALSKEHEAEMQMNTQKVKTCRQTYIIESKYTVILIQKLQIM